jgi:hypothetical protein
VGDEEAVTTSIKKDKIGEIMMHGGWDCEPVVMREMPGAHDAS